MCYNATMRVRSLFVALLLISQFTFAQGSNPVNFLSDYAKEQGSLVKGDLAVFSRLTQPYAPLDVQTSGLSIDQARQFKASFFGIAAGASGIGLDKTLAMTNTFHCPDCGPKRKDDLAKDVSAIRPLVEQFKSLPKGITLIAQWGSPGDFRINSIFHQGDTTKEFPTENGIFPGAPGRPFESISAALKPLGIDKPVIDSLLKQMATLRIIALVRTPEGIRAIRSGITRSVAGLLFLEPGVDSPKPREEENGFRINGFFPVAEDVFYFET
jgi:hypothetical protein